MLIALFFLFMAIPRERRHTTCMGCGIRQSAGLDCGSCKPDERADRQVRSWRSVSVASPTLPAFLLHAGTTLPIISGDPATLT